MYTYGTLASDIDLPQVSVKPYIQYGVGLQKSWGERFTAYGQVMMRNGGRNGIAGSIGFRWTIGNDDNENNPIDVEIEYDSVLSCIGMFSYFIIPNCTYGNVGM